MCKRGISQEMLKCIACAAMLLDHIGAALVPALWLRIVGRIALPIFCFALSEGIHHTKNPKRYCLRLLLGAALAELPYDLLFYGRATNAHQSIMVTLLLGFCYGILQKKTERIEGKILLLLPFMLAAKALHTDYGMWGVAMVALFVLTRELPNRAVLQFVGLGVICVAIGGLKIPLLGLRMPIQMFALAALPLIWSYSGERGRGAAWMQWAFYLFYPAHLIVLLLLRRL